MLINKNNMRGPYALSTNIYQLTLSVYPRKGRAAEPGGRQSAGNRSGDRPAVLLLAFVVSDFTLQRHEALILREQMTNPARPTLQKKKFFTGA